MNDTLAGHLDAVRALDPGAAVARLIERAAGEDLLDVAYAVLDAAGRFIPPLPALGLFVFGWILQGVGHWVYEKNSPAFFRNFVHLAIGQLWILAKAVGRA